MSSLDVICGGLVFLDVLELGLLLGHSVGVQFGASTGLTGGLDLASLVFAGFFQWIGSWGGTGICR